MKFIKTEIPDLVIIEPVVIGDDRGYFFESFKKDEFEKEIGKIDFVQENESKSSRGVLRGLHFQRPPFTQAKLVRAVLGEVLDVAVDIRTDSPTFGQYVSVILSGENKRQFYIPGGFAHGFVVLSETAVFQYKVDNIYAPDYDDGIIYNDPDLNIDWKLPEEMIKLSKKDKRMNLFKDSKLNTAK
ncbi:MAG: dTDP-4-dehydrorhamnose 3,5-epimerase [Chlorobi bacterium]|nr:dTDP-4-dehydrorhamnose 3,5-epimerase [Chlorobiota bacterium]